jgi:mannose-6-phosphate isomerase-like protein (cupin superfamily)
MVVSSNVVLFLPGVQPTCAALNREKTDMGGTRRDGGKHKGQAFAARRRKYLRQGQRGHRLKSLAATLAKRSKWWKRIASRDFSRARITTSRHTRHFTFLRGSADFQVGDELFHVQKGSCVHIPPGVPHQVTSNEGVCMLMIYSPAGTEGMFAAMHALSQEQLMNAEFTRQLALKHDTVMIEQSKDGRGKGTILG